MKIIKTATGVELEYTCKIARKNKKYERKDGSIGRSQFYQATLPESFREYAGIQNDMYFHEERHEILISNTPVTDRDVKIKIQKTGTANQFSLPRGLFPNLDNYTFVRLIYVLEVSGGDLLSIRLL